MGMESVFVVRRRLSLPHNYPCFASGRLCARLFVSCEAYVGPGKSLTYGLLPHLIMRTPIAARIANSSGSPHWMCWSAGTPFHLFADSTQIRACSGTILWQNKRFCFAVGTSRDAGVGSEEKTIDQRRKRLGSRGVPA